MLIVTGSITARPDTLAELEKLALEHVHRSRLEPGCISHAVHRDVENPLRLVFFEEWADKAALDTHFAVPASGAFVRAARGLASEATAIAIYEASPVTPS